VRAAPVSEIIPPDHFGITNDMAELAPFDYFREFFRVGPRNSLKHDGRIVEDISSTANTFRRVSDHDLRNHAEQLRALVRGGRDCTDHTIVVQAFALVYEATRRALGLKYFDVQLLAGLALARGSIAEMATGEGKTLAATLPAFLHSLCGWGVHIATPNAYLAERDFMLVEPILRLLGVTVGLVPESAKADQKRAAYACDITYATGYELGFDYLRDQLHAIRTPRPKLGQRQQDLLRGLSPSPTQTIQPRRACVIIDEIDSVLIDEAYLPLILCEGSDAPNSLAATYVEARRVSGSLYQGDDYQVDAAAKRVTLTNQGLQQVYDDYNSRLRLKLDRPWATYVEQAISAQVFHKRDVDYIVRDGKVMLVDEFTGRIFPNRSYCEGLHQAVEVKEDLLPSGELATAARISRQRYFRLYKMICGMTGTATGSDREFRRLYRLPVVSIPLRNPCRRTIFPTRYFRDAESKLRALVQEVAKIHQTGRPVLIGSRTIRNSELLAQRLESAGIHFQLLNGKQDKQEAEIVTMAGHAYAVTIATNMAGRGTDIQLGTDVAKLGGMHVIGFECHESQRIDRQLLGRAGRQGDPGSGRFLVSADDALLCRFGPSLRRRMQSMRHNEGEISCDLADDVAAVQRAAEAAARSMRRQMLAFDDWLDETLAALGDEG
jgi:preprotein translocase subunit SecA